MNYGDSQRDQSCLAILKRRSSCSVEIDPQAAVSIEALIDFIAEKDPALVNAVGRLDLKLFDQLVQDLETLRNQQGRPADRQGEPLDIEALLGLGAQRDAGQDPAEHHQHQVPGDNAGRRILGRPAPDDAGPLDQRVARAVGNASGRRSSSTRPTYYLPAVGKPATKEPMENLLRRARSAGLGLLLATQSPGDFDYKCRDNIRTWFVGQVKEAELDRQDEADAQRMPHRHRQPAARPGTRRVPLDPRRRRHQLEDLSVRRQRQTNSRGRDRVARPRDAGTVKRRWGVEKLGFTEIKGWIQDVCFCCASSVRPPLEKGGQGGLKGIAHTLGRCDNSAEDSRPGTAPGRGYAGIPPLPPLLKGGTVRNRIRMETRHVQDQLFKTPVRRYALTPL